MLVLVAGGVALALGLLLVRLRAFRSVITPLAVLVVVALAGLAFADSLALLVQPIALGVALALLATGIDRVLKRGRPAPLLSPFPGSATATRGVGRPTDSAGVPVLAGVSSTDRFGATRVLPAPLPGEEFAAATSSLVLPGEIDSEHQSGSAGGPHNGPRTGSGESP